MDRRPRFHGRGLTTPGRTLHRPGLRNEVGRVALVPVACVPISPMIGSLGTAPAGEAMPVSRPGHGGDLDQPLCRAGAIVYLSVFADCALLYAADVHAAEAGGGIFRIAVEAAAVRFRRVPIAGCTRVCPWVLTEQTAAVAACGETFEIVRRKAVDAMLGELAGQFGVSGGKALALMSAAGSLRICQANGGMELMVCLKMPRPIMDSFFATSDAAS